MSDDPEYDNARICPECDAGKHQNCDETAWNFTLDERVDCLCWMEAHYEDIREHG